MQKLSYGFDVNSTKYTSHRATLLGNPREDVIVEYSGTGDSKKTEGSRFLYPHVYPHPGQQVN